jgi:hypothetical protein
LTVEQIGQLQKLLAEARQKTETTTRQRRQS